jgi:cytochrome c biogenesis protein CcdA
MNTLLHRESQLNQRRTPDSARRVELSEKHSLALMGFFILVGLLSVLADVFTNTVPMPQGLRDFWLVICVVTFGLMIAGVTLFALSYKPTKPSDGHPVPKRK